MTSRSLQSHFGQLIRIATLIGMWSAAASAQMVGNVATLEGTVEIGRGGAWSNASLGGEIQKGDIVRTGRPGRVRIVFQDNSVLKLGDSSELAISEQLYDPSQAGGSSVLNLVRGKARAIVSDYYKDPNARFEVRTATAVSGVRGTDFVVAYDESEALTEVVGVTGKVAVGGASHPNRAPVIIGGRQMTRVGRDGFVSPAQRAGEAVFRQVLEDVDFIGQGGPESVSSAVTDGTSVAAADHMAGGAVLSGGTAPVRAFAEDGIFPPDPSSLIGQPPGSAGLGEVSIPF